MVIAGCSVSSDSFDSGFSVSSDSFDSGLPVSVPFSVIVVGFFVVEL